MMELIGCSYEEATHVRANNNILEIMNTSGSEFVIDVNCRRTVLEHSVALRLGFVFMKEAPKHIEIDNIRTLGTQGRTVVVVYDDEFDDEATVQITIPKCDPLWSYLKQFDGEVCTVVLMKENV